MLETYWEEKICRFLYSLVDFLQNVGQQICAAQKKFHDYWYLPMICVLDILKFGKILGETTKLE
jgi:hypothetical protein